MRLFVCLVLTLMVVAPAFAQDGTGAQIEAVNALPNVDVQVMNETLRDDGNTTETESVDTALDPSTAIVDAVADAVETVAASLSDDAPVTDDEAVVVEEAVQEDPVTTEIADEEAVVDDVDEVAVVDEVDEVDDEELQEEPAPTMEVLEEEAAEGDETLPEEDAPTLEAVAVDTLAPEDGEDDSPMEEDDTPVEEDDAPIEEDDAPVEESDSPVEFNPTVMSVEDPPEPEPEPTADGTFDADESEEPLVDIEEEARPIPPFCAPCWKVNATSNRCDYDKDEPGCIGLPIQGGIPEPRQPTKKELKAIEKYNTAADNILKIVSGRLTGQDALPLNVTEEVLEELDTEATTVPPTTTTTTTTTEAPAAALECPAKWEDKCAEEKCLGKPKCVQKCKDKGCITKKNKKKNKNRKNSNNKNNNKKNKNKNKKQNKKNKKKNKNRLFGAQIFSRNHRQSKDLDLDELEEQGRRSDNGKVKKVKDNKDQKEKKKRKKNKKNNQSRLEPEAKLDYVPKSAEEGSLFATNEELLGAPALFMGFSQIRRDGDVEVDLSGKWPRFVVPVRMGPLNVLLTNPASQFKRTEVTTELTAKMHFTAKQARNREKLKINEVVVEVPETESVNVLRSDLDLEPEVVSAAQDEVVAAIDTDRLARIIHQDLDVAFGLDNILQNLEDHPSLKA